MDEEENVAELEKGTQLSILENAVLKNETVSKKRSRVSGSAIDGNWKQLQRKMKRGKTVRKRREKPKPTNGEEAEPSIVTEVKPNCVAIDCEMVEVEGHRSALARVAVVDFDGDVLYDKYVKPKEKIVDYRTFVSGIRPRNLILGENCVVFKEAQTKVKELLSGNILVGHSLDSDLKVLKIKVSKDMRRDTASYAPLKRETGGSRKLSELSEVFLGKTIQTGAHSPVEDAQAAMSLYKVFRKRWEKGQHSR